MTKISVIIPVYNVEKYLDYCLSSIQNQTYKDFEVLCYEDCSSDNSKTILEKFVSSDNRFKLICNENTESKGASVGRNTGLDVACGEYIFFVDSDDYLNPTAFEKVVNRFEQTNADSVWFDYDVYYEEKNKNLTAKAIYGDCEEKGFYNVTPDNIAECPTYIWNKAYKKSAIGNLRFPVGLYFQDSEFYFKLFTNIKRINYINESLYTYRIRKGSTVTRSAEEDLKNVDHMFIIFDNLYNYAVEKNIFKDYKKAFLKMMGLRLQTYRLKEQYAKSIKLCAQMLEKVGFPENFKEFEN